MLLCYSKSHIKQKDRADGSMGGLVELRGLIMLQSTRFIVENTHGYGNNECIQ